MFTPLDEMFNGDQQKICRMLKIFLRVSQEDLAALEAAFADGDWEKVKFMAHSMKSACLQIGEGAAGESLMDLESMAGPGPVAEHELSRVKDALARAFTRAADHVVAHGEQGSCCNNEEPASHAGRSTEG